MLVREMMHRDFVALPPDADLAAARARLHAKRAHHLLVLDGDQVLGVVAMRDLVGLKDATPISAVMTTDVATIDAESTLRRAASLMVRSTSGVLPVVIEGRVAGIITSSDLMKVLDADMTLS